MVITIDGPAGVGKSTVARQVAEQLGFDFLDTGAMYRAIGLAVLRRGVDLSDVDRIAAVADAARIEFDYTARPPRILLDGQDVGEEIRSPEATNASSMVAKIPAVREVLVRQQREIGLARPNLVTEGRDQGSVVFPDARRKFFLEAAASERARRRADQLRQAGKAVEETELEREIRERDARDAGRAVGPLVAAPDAIRLDTTALSPQQVVDFIVAEVRRAQSEGKPPEARS